MKKFMQLTASTALMAVISLLPIPASAGDCSDKSKSVCSNNASCSWVSGYTTKVGTRVKSYCRAKPGKSLKKNNKKDKKRRSKKKKKDSNK